MSVVSVRKTAGQGYEEIKAAVNQVIADLGGLDIFCGISEYLFADLADDKAPQALLRQKKASGKLGLKSGEGFFDYSGDRGAKAGEERNRKLSAISKILFNT